MREHSSGGGPGRFTVSDVLGPWSGGNADDSDVISVPNRSP